MNVLHTYQTYMSACLDSWYVLSRFSVDRYALKFPSSHVT